MERNISKKYYLSKTLFMKGLQCHKSLYLHKYMPELEDKITEEKEYLFNIGYEVGALAQGLFPDGIEVPYEGLSHSEQIAMTQSLIRNGRSTIYEAAFFYDGIFIKADILHKGCNGWDMYEVKASSSVKAYHINDVSLQYYVLSGSGLPISRAFVVHIDTDYVRHGDIEIDKLFNTVDLTETAKAKESFIRQEIQKQRRMLSGDEPVIDIGPYCDDPFECDFMDHCWAHIPKDSIFDLRGCMDTKFFLYKQGILSMYDVPPDLLSVDQFCQVEANINKQFYYNHDAVRTFIASLWYPMYFLDFETFWPAVPPFDGTRPYRQIPFQYSLHYIEHERGDLKHHEYLAVQNRDHRKDLAEKLISEIPDDACILVYNKSFERLILRNLASWFPEYAEKIETIIGNIRDLMDPFRR